MRYSNITNHGTTWLRSSFSSCVLMVAMAVALLVAPRAHSDSVVYDFNAGPGAGTLLRDATVANGALELTHYFHNSAGAFRLPDPAPNRLVRAFVANFKVRMIPGVGGHADGFSFNWATDLPDIVLGPIFGSGANGVGSGLSVCFETSQGLVDIGLCAVELKWGRSTVQYQSVPLELLLSGNNEFVDFSIRLHTNGTVDVTCRSTPIFSGVPLPGFRSWLHTRFGLDASTDENSTGPYGTHTIDDLAIQFDAVAPSEDSVDASVPGDRVTGTSTNSPAAQDPSRAIDNTVTNKYLNFDKLNTGLSITPSGQGPVGALTLISAEDAPERDPSSFVLEGSNDGVVFTRIASNSVPAFPARNFIQSFAVVNTTLFNSYRVRFPTVFNAAAANSMQIAEVELLYHEEITSPSDAVSITLPPGAADVRGVGMLFDRQLGLTRKFEVAPISGGNTVVNIIPALGAAVLKGFELIGAADDFTFPQRRPSSITIAGSNDGNNYMNLTTVVPAAPSSNLQIQEFPTSSNNSAFARYRITFGPPVGGDRLQVGEMRLFGEFKPEIAVFAGATTNAVSERFDNVGTHVFAETTVGSNSIRQTFTIKNTGTGYLRGLAVSETGSGAIDYLLGTLGTASLGPNATTTFTVGFTPTVPGARQVVVNIASNDGDENPFRINVAGTGGSIVEASAPGDLAVATTGGSLANQPPPNAIDNDVSTKYFNFDKLDAGLTITPLGRRPVRALTLISADDVPARDPSSFVLEGSYDGVNFTPIARNAVPPFSARHFLQSFPIPNNIAFEHYRLRFPTVADATSADAMQIAEVELLYHEEITSPSDAVTITLPPGALAVRGASNLFDRQLDSPQVLAVDTITNANTVVNVTLAEGGRVLKGFELIGTQEDLVSPERLPSRVTVAGSKDGITYIDLATVVLAAPSLNLQIQEFATASNTNNFARYRITFGPPVAGHRLVVGEVRLFGQAPSGPDILEASVPGDLAAATSGSSPTSQDPPSALDNDVTTKYFNFDKLNAGLIITPLGRRPVRALTLISADDVPGRDPSSFVLEGSQDGTSFTRIASNAVPLFPARHAIQSFPVANNIAFHQYRLRFPTVADVASADAMQIAEVELLYDEEITSPGDAVSITLPPGAADLRGVRSLFDRQLGDVRKLEVAPIANADTVVNVTLAEGGRALKGFELIAAADDFLFPERRPSRVTVAGSTDGTHYTNLAMIVPAAPSANLQIQEFATPSNNTAFARYRITFGPPVSGDRLQVGEMRLFGVFGPEISVFTGAGTNAANARSDSMGTNVFPNTPLGQASAAQTFTIKNVGTAPLTGLLLYNLGADPNEFVPGSLGATTLAPQATTTFTVTFSPTIAGTRRAVVNIASSDGDEDPFRINVTGTALTPEIAVFTGATTNAGSARTDNVGTNLFANTVVGASSAAQTFTIKNVGSANLTGLVLSKVGVNLGDFTLGALGLATLAPQATTTFTITFAPSAPGTRNAAVNLASNDSDENPFHINVRGVATTEVSALVDASTPGDAIAASSTNWPVGFGAANAIDNTAATKYLNFDRLNTGMTITPTGRRLVRALTLISADDVPERDPSSFVLEGSLDGTNFTRIASNAITAFPTRHFVQSIAFPNANLFNSYRLLFPTVSNAAAANSIQIAEVELLYNQEITSTNDAVSITLPPGAVDVRGVGSLFDRQLDGVRKLEIAPIAAGGSTVVDVIPAAGASVLKGFELIGAADDFTFPQRRPSSVVVAGSDDGSNYTDLATFTPAAPSSNLQLQEFSTASNTMAFARYRITFGSPVGGDRIQVGEMRLFGEISQATPVPKLTIRASGGNALVSWLNVAGFNLETKAALADLIWSPVNNVPMLSNGVNSVTLPASGAAAFFRLRK